MKQHTCIIVLGCRKLVHKEKEKEEEKMQYFTLFESGLEILPPSYLMSADQKSTSKAPPQVGSVFSLPVLKLLLPPSAPMTTDIHVHHIPKWSPF